MADVNAQSIEDYADRIVYRFAGGRYEQVLTTFQLAASVGLKTLVNTDTTRAYIVPKSAVQARFYKIELEIYSSINITDTAGVLYLMEAKFFKVSIPSLNFDGKSLSTEFYGGKSEMFYTSSYLRAINIGNILAEPCGLPSQIQFQTPSGLSFAFTAGTTGLRAIIVPTVTFYKK